MRDVIRDQHMQRLQGCMGLGHVRYPTAGGNSSTEAQPLYVNSPYGLSMVHNGNLINDRQLAGQLRSHDLRHLNTHSDSEVLLNVFAHELQKRGRAEFSTAALFAAASALYQRVQGAFAAVIMIHGHGLLALRDQHGIRPLVYGSKPSASAQAHQQSYMVASESVALDALGYQLLANVGAGEAVFFPADGGPLQRHQCVPGTQLTPCLFEYIYLARPDSIIDGISVHQARLNMGRALARKLQAENLLGTIDVVIPVPDTSRSAALALAQSLGLPYSEGFIKNRYIARTFIMPQQRERRHAVRLKLNAMRSEFEGKRVLLVDDSIVRGTTSCEIVAMAREAGAKAVYFASAAPAIRHPNVYGIDMPAVSELIAHQRSAADVAQLIDADWVLYQDLEDVITATLAARLSAEAHQVKAFEAAVFDGHYVSGGVDTQYLAYLASKRSGHPKSIDAAAMERCIEI